MDHASSEAGTASQDHDRPISAVTKLRYFAKHLGGMALAMMAGMAAGALMLAIIFSTVLSSAVSGMTTEEATAHYAVLICLVVAAGMISLMTAWMRYRGMAWRPVTEMAVAMVAPLGPILGLLWLDVIPGASACGACCAVMIPAMIVAMLARLNLYTVLHAAHMAHTR